jgi:hypothetical protein
MTKEIQKEMGLSPLQQRIEILTRRVQTLAEILGLQGIHVKECNCQLCEEMKARRN